jgi:hypothetical protein
VSRLFWRAAIDAALCNTPSSTAPRRAAALPFRRFDCQIC